MQVCTFANGKTAGDGLRKTLEPVDHRDQDVFHSAVVQLVHDLEPEFGSLVLLIEMPSTSLVPSAAMPSAR